MAPSARRRTPMAGTRWSFLQRRDLVDRRCTAARGRRPECRRGSAVDRLPDRRILLCGRELHEFPRPATSAGRCLERRGSWSAATTALPGDAVAGSTGTSLSSVSCSSSTSCAAVGPGVGPAGHQEAFAARLISGSWSNSTRLQPPAGVTSTEEFANVIDCSGTTCVTPFSVRTNGTGVGYLALLSAGAWTITNDPLPPGASSGGVDAVSCASSTVCTGVGQYAVDTSTGGVASEQDHGLAEHLFGGTGNVASSVDTVGANATYLYWLDCPSTGFCAAIGIGADFGSVLLVESNGVWSAYSCPRGHRQPDRRERPDKHQLWRGRLVQRGRRLHRFRGPSARHRRDVRQRHLDRVAHRLVHPTPTIDGSRSTQSRASDRIRIALPSASGPRPNGR